MKSNWLFILLFFIITIVVTQGLIQGYHNKRLKDQEYAEYVALQPKDSAWIAPSLFLDRETTGKQRAMVMYGKDIIAHTSKYFGPNGTINKITNGMNCQNCHLDAGTRPWGNNYGAVFSKYPQYRGRSNSIQDIYGRINDCFERSLNGKAIDTASYEMKSIYAYMKWLGKNVPKGTKPYGAGLPSIPFINTQASVVKGKAVYVSVCQTCHGDEGQGLPNLTTNEYVYPPLWGKHSFNDGAGLYRLSSFAGYVEYNMPYNIASHDVPKLTIEEAWNVAAFVNSQPRPHVDQSKDWPDITKKVFDVSFGPYTDNFSERQHKYGPFQEIIKADKTK